MKKYRFEAIQKNEVVTIHQSFNITTENSRMALMIGLQSMVQDETATSIKTSIKPLSDFVEGKKQIRRIADKKWKMSMEDHKCPHGFTFGKDWEFHRICLTCEDNDDCMEMGL